MFLDKSLSIALLVSMVLHVTFLLPLSGFKNSSKKRNSPALTITYLAPKKIFPRNIRLRKKTATAVSKPASKKNIVAKIKVDNNSKQKDESVKEVVSAPKSASQHLQIEIPPELPKEKEALYLDYYQSIRAKIRNFVVKNYPRYIACGEVRLYFVLSSQGELKEINVLEEKSSQNRLLKEIAKKSIQQASPFLPFPQELNQAQLSFNVIVSFELEN